MTALALLLPFVPAPAVAKPADISVIAFPGAGRWPLWVAQDRGIDRRNDVWITAVETRNSVDQMAGLADGTHEIAITAFDNVVAYHSGVGNSGLRPLPVVAVMGLDAGLLSFVARSEYRALGDLKGQTLAVDAPRTGYVFALRETLRRAGHGDDDYTLMSIGGTALRYEALVSGSVAAALLTPPFTAIAEGRGLRRLADVSGTLGPYQGAVVAVRSDWAARNANLLARYIATHRDALAWLHQPANRRAAIEIYRKRLPDASQEAAEAAYATLVRPGGGLSRDGHLDEARMSAVLAMRARSGPAGAKLGPVEDYVQSSYLDAAKRLRSR